MSTPESARMSFGRVAAGLGAVALFAATINAPIAQAATVNNAIRSVDVVETTAAAGDSVKVAATWAVPDGSKAGDTFTLTLPTMLVTNALSGVTRDLKDKDGEVVARYVVSGQTVTFTLTEYAEDHIGISGTAHFGVTLARSLAPDPRTPVQFQVNGAVWPQIDYIDVTGPKPGDDYSGSASKWQNWRKVGDDPRGGILWAITGPSVPESLAHGSTYVIRDVPGAGQQIDCTEMHLWQGDKNIGGELTNRTYVGTDRYTKECTADSASVTIKPTARDVGKVFMLLGYSVVTDPNLSEYKNSGTVTLWGTANYPANSTLKVEAGGDGQGSVPSPSPAPGTPPPTTVTVTAPGVPVVVVPPVVVQPGQPAPPPVTTTVTATPTAGATPIASGAPVSTATPTVTVTDSPSTPVSGGAPATSTTTVTRTINAAPVAGGTRVSSGSPSRIDTGQPADEVNTALLTAGGLLTAGSLGALALAGRDALRRRRH